MSQKGLGDKMRIYSLCSSSSGNCTDIEEKNSGILIDAGFGVRNTCRFLAEAGSPETRIRAIFITHEHSDHISGLNRLTQRWKIPVYASYGTLEKLLEKDAISADVKLYEINRRPAVIEDLSITAFHTPHDSAESLGFFVSNGKLQAGFCTDLGYVPDDVSEGLAYCKFVLLESNYDPAMLQAGNYPFLLKERIASNFGHLSNDDCALQVKKLLCRGVQRFLLGHLSRQNNLPELAYENVVSYLLSNGFQVGIDYQLAVAPVRNTNYQFVEL